MTGVEFMFRVTLRRHIFGAGVLGLKEPVKVSLMLKKGDCAPKQTQDLLSADACKRGHGD
jgi:hypothetical protein